MRRARRLGLESWVTDWSPPAVARSEADHFEPVDLKDREATLALARTSARRRRADGGGHRRAYIADRLRLPGHPPALAEQAANKFAMRRQTEASGIACPATAARGGFRFRTRR